MNRTETLDTAAALAPNSYTVHRLQHATPEHLQLTTRRCFIGPIPEGWLNSHRREWYKRHLGIHYSSRTASFSAGSNVGRHRRLTGIDGPSATASFGQSFPQPGDVDDEDEEEEYDDDDDVVLDSNEPHAVATNEEPPAIPVPRTEQLDASNTAPKRRGSDLIAKFGVGRKSLQSAGTNARNLRRESAPEGIHTTAPYNSSQPDPAKDHSKSVSVIPISGQRSSTEGDAQHDRDEGQVSSHGISEQSDAGPSSPSMVSSGATTPRASATPINGLQSLPNPSPEQDSTLSARQRNQERSTTDATESSRTGLYISAATSPLMSKESVPRLRDSRSGSLASFETAHEDLEDDDDRRLSAVHEAESPLDTPKGQRALSPEPSVNGPATIEQSSTENNSTKSLLTHTQQGGEPATNPTSAGVKAPTRTEDPTPAAAKDDETNQNSPPLRRTGTGLVRFEIPDNEDEQMIQTRLAQQMRKRDSWRRVRQGHIEEGRIIKMERLLVRVEFSPNEIPADFTENDSEKIEIRIVEKWKEFMCVCREYDSDRAPFTLHLYKTRVIPATEKHAVKRRWTYEIVLDRNECKVNLYSSLDKTLVICVPKQKGNMIFTMTSRSGANSMEWFTFLRNVLGLDPISMLQVNVPDLAVNLRLENPFENIESFRNLAQAADGDEDALQRTMREEQAAAATIVQRCMDMLHKAPGLSDVIEQWSGTARMGLAWKHYDRLEWIYGANESKMYGTMGMAKSHVLELRPKQHYPTSVSNGPKEQLVEPPPVEGFLVRLTSQRGVDQKVGRLFFKRLYFSTHNQYLVFNRPAHANPPPPPRLPMTERGRVPTSSEIADKIPLIYSINPYPITEGAIDWLRNESLQTPAQRIESDRDAFDEHERKLSLVQGCDGLINLCNVVQVRNMQRGAAAVDQHIDSGSDVDFDQSVSNTHRDDGQTHHMDERRTFEIVLRNGLVIRLQAFNKTTQHEWKVRLRALVAYWKLRAAADTHLLMEIRNENLQRLKIDATSEAYIGKFARNWEFTGSYASPQLYHMCGIDCCRSVHMSGLLYRKPRMHGVFKRFLVLLSNGKLIMFRDSLRNRRGEIVKHIHHERVGTLDLRECYVYSGLATGGNLLYESQGPNDGAHSLPGRHALPRMFVDDAGWSSVDEDVMTCFVIWHGKKHSWFRRQAGMADDHDEDGHKKGLGSGRTRQRLSRVRALGTEGMSVVFKTRSRAERDRWVLAVAMEIERLGGGMDVRIKDEDGD